MVQVIGHKNQALISSKIQKKRMRKIGVTIRKTCTGITNPKIQKRQQTYTSAQAMTAFIIIIQKKRPSATQKTHRSDTLQKRPEEQQKVTQKPKVFQKLKLQSQRFQKQIHLLIKMIMRLSKNPNTH